MACFQYLHLGILNAVYKDEPALGVSEWKIEENLAKSVETFLGFIAPSNRHFYFKLFIFCFFRLQYNIKILHLSFLMRRIWVLLFLVLLSLSFIRDGKFSFCDVGGMRIEHFRIILGRKMDHASDTLRIIIKLNRNNSFLNHFSFNTFHHSITIIIFNSNSKRKKESFKM